MLQHPTTKTNEVKNQGCLRLASLNALVWVNKLRSSSSNRECRWQATNRYHTTVHQPNNHHSSFFHSTVFWQPPVFLPKHFCVKAKGVLVCTLMFNFLGAKQALPDVFESSLGSRVTTSDNQVPVNLLDHLLESIWWTACASKHPHLDTIYNNVLACNRPLAGSMHLWLNRQTATTSNRVLENIGKQSGAGKYWWTTPFLTLHCMSTFSTRTKQNKTKQ